VDQLQRPTPKASAPATIPLTGAPPKADGVHFPKGFQGFKVGGKVQVTTSPGASATAEGKEPSLQVAETSSQPAGSGLWVATYVPGRTVADW